MRDLPVGDLSNIDGLDAVEGSWLIPPDLGVPVDGVGHLVLHEPLSFWGGFDASTGRIIDRAHPQHGAVLGGKVVAMPGSKGSSGTPGVLGDAIRRGTGPAALIVTKPDINLVAGSLTAAALYGITCPILLVSDLQLERLIRGTNET